MVRCWRPNLVSRERNPSLPTLVIQAVRKGPWKLLIIKDEVGLYNVDDDLGENDNLAPHKPKLVAELKAELADHYKQQLQKAKDFHESL